MKNRLLIEIRNLMNLWNKWSTDLMILKMDCPKQ